MLVLKIVHDEVNRAHLQVLSFLNLKLKCYGMQKKDVCYKFSFEKDTQLQILKCKFSNWFFLKNKHAYLRDMGDRINGLLDII